MPEKLHDRSEAGKLLADKLAEYKDRSDVIILALPRGGVPIGYEISQKIHVPFDLLLVRKLGVPWHEELAMGAIAGGDIKILNNEIIANIQISTKEIDKVVAQEKIELERRNHLYRQDKPLPLLKDKIVIIVDDGLATGATMRAAVAAIRQTHPAKIIVAVPVAPRDTFQIFQKLTDKIITLQLPVPFYSIGQWYDYFPQVSDEEVIQLLSQCQKHSGDTHDQ